ncbi:MAG: AAA family ATPase [Treponema sp.]|nr:AAA family ATPase [Candidatus Treponema equi]
MKPLFIKMKNIGPFVDEELDFTCLDEVFLLCGDTGAGKTTIFDAMTFALYGEFLGARKNKSKDFRSQYAKDGEESFVELEFSSCGEKFRVRRTLPYNYINRNGKLSQKDSEVSLEQWNSNADCYEFFNGGKNEIKARLEEIIGLRAEEFSKIVILPQGEFSEFLRANSNAKQEMLRKLFPVDFYQTIVEKIKAENDELQGDIKVLEGSMKELSKDVDFNNAEEKIESLSVDYEKSKKLLDKLHKEKEELATDLAKLESELKLAAELEDSAAELKALEKKSASMEQLGERLALADEAELLSPFVEGKNTRLEEEKSANLYLEESKVNLDNAQKLLDSLKKKSGENEKTEKQLQENRVLLKVYEDSLESAEKYAKELEHLDSVKKKLKEVMAFLEKESKAAKSNEDKLRSMAESVGITCGDLEPGEICRLVSDSLSRCKEKSLEAARLYSSAQEFESVAKEIKSSEAELQQLMLQKEERTKQIEDMEKLLAEYRKNREDQLANNTACSLVSLLKPGCPCPVCGSTEHPSPAKASGEYLDFDEKIRVTEKSIESETELRSLCAEKIAGGKKVLEKYAVDFEKLKKDCGSISSEDAFKEASAVKEKMYALQNATEVCDDLLKKIDSSSKKIAELKDESSRLESECASVEATLEILESQVKKSGGSSTDPEKIRSDIDGLKENIDLQAREVESFRREYEAADRGFVNSKARLEEAENGLETAKINARTSVASFEKKLAESKFESEKEVENCLIDRDEKLELKEELKDYHDEVSRLKASIEVLSEKVTEKSSVLQKKVMALESEMETKEKTISTASDDMERILSEKKNMEKVYDQYRKYADRYGKLAAKGAPLAALYKDLSGNNPSKVQFETWFLGLYFDDVVTCASRHLLRISGDRYEFKMDTEKTGGNSYHGLDLVVHDYRTNQDRDTATLSGGETFMASISLALGLTEVVQKSSRLDSLFIDEGFGSLDKESLEMAVGVLQDIGTSRTVGVISHVEEMLGAIPCHVEVKKTARGSHISAC